MCPSCVAPGVHAPEHLVGTLANLYRQKREANEVIPIRVKDKFESQVRALLLKRQELAENYSEAKRYIQLQKDRALEGLQQLYSQRSMALASDELQLKILNEKLDWAKAFIKFQEKTLKPHHYFRSQQQ